MKIGYCINMLADDVDLIGRKWLGALQQAGYDYVELPLAQIMDLSEEAFCALLEQLKTLSVPCEACNNFFPKEIRLTGPDVCIEQIENYVQEAVSRADRLGAKVIVFGSAGAKNVPEGFNQTEAFEQVVRVLRLVNDRVMDAGIEIAIEPLNRKESNLILNLEDGIKLVEAVNCKSIQLLVDYYHFFLEKDTEDRLADAMPHLIHVHFANPEGRTIPTVLDDKQKRFFAFLQSQGYEGRFSVEAFAANPEQDLPICLKQCKE